MTTKATQQSKNEFFFSKTDICLILTNITDLQQIQYFFLLTMVVYTPQYGNK